MKKLLLLPLLLLICYSSARAEKIDWEMIVKQTNEQNPVIQSAKLTLNNAKIAYDRAISGYMPNVSLNGSASQGENDKNFSRSYSYGLSASLSVFSGFGTYNEVRQRAAELKAAEAQYQRRISDVAYETAAQYVNLMWAYETVDLLAQIKERRIENKDMINLKYNSGNVDIGSLKRVEADVETASYDLRKAQRYIETASAALLKAIGRNDTVVLETDERLLLKERELSKPDLSNLVTTIPEFLISQYSADSYKALSARAKSDLWPSINISGNLSRYDSQWAPDKQGWDAGVSLSYPLFAGGTRYFDIKTASNQYKIAQENHINTSNLLKSNAVSYYNNLIDSYENIVAKEHYLSASKLQAEISQRKYVNGLSTYQDWYSIENDYITSQKSLLDVKKAAALERAKWYNFIGEGFIKPGK